MGFFSGSGGLVNDQLVRRYQAEVARRAKVLEQDTSFRWPGEDEPLMMLSGSPPIPPPTDKAATPSRSPIPDTTPPKLFGDDPDHERRAAIYEQLLGTAGSLTALPPGEYDRAARRMELYEQPSRDTPLPLRLSELQEPPTVSQSPPIVPPSVGDTAGASPPDPSVTFGGAGTFRADATVVRPSEQDGGAGNPAVQTAILPLFKLDAERQELLSPLPAIEPHKQKKDARGRPARPRSKSTARAQTKQSAIINRVEVIRQTKALIVVLEEVLDYDPVRGHNQTPPILWSGDPSYRKDVKALVGELRRLNSLLEAKRPRKKEAERVVVDLARHFDQFLHSYVSWFGKGAAALTICVIAGLLQHAGLDPAAVCSAVKLPH